MQKRNLQMIMAVIAIGSLAIGTTELAFADNGSNTTSSSILFGVFITAGIVWSISGYLSNWRSHIEWQKANPGTSDPNWSGFDRTALRDDIFIGLVLGGIAFLTNSTIDAATITTAQAFGAAVIASMGAVALADKVVVGTVLNR